MDMNKAPLTHTMNMQRNMKMNVVNMNAEHLFYCQK